MCVVKNTPRHLFFNKKTDAKSQSFQCKGSNDLHTGNELSSCLCAPWREDQCLHGY